MHATKRQLVSSDEGEQQQKQQQTLTSAEEPPRPSINLDHILSSTPYKDMLRDLFGADSSTRASKSLRVPAIPVVTKAYEESFMREPMWEYERTCVMGSNCECNFIGTRQGEGFIGVEFILPSEASMEASERARSMCVLCHRRLVQSLFYDIIYAGVCVFAV